jgi:adenosylmethionine-8-amino-7-oxononanoate aminotransferase
MGRTGYLHAWQKEGVAPDIQVIGKGLAGGFQQLSAMLVGPKVSDAFEYGPGTGAFSHGHTFQNFPLGCAAGLEVQKIIQEEHLLQNVREKGTRLSKALKKRLGSHPHVGDIRGAGLFWGVSIDRITICRIMKLTQRRLSLSKINRQRNHSPRRCL